MTGPDLRPGERFGVRLFDALDYFALAHPDSLFARSEENGGISISYADAADATRRIANGICNRELAQGDRVAILARNRLDLVLLYYGCARAGVVPVPLNYRLAPPEWSYIVNDSGARAMFATAELAQALEPVRSELASVDQWFELDGTADHGGWEAYPDWVASQSNTPCPRHIDGASDAYQMYTSGTTGRPKGAVVAHNAVASNAQQVQLSLDVAPSDCMLVVAPLYHAAAGIVVFTTISQGGSLFIQEDFVPAEAVRAMSEEGISKALLVPAMIQACLVAVPDVAERPYDELATVVYGASPIAVETLRRAMDVFGCDFIQGYGMTETTAVLTNLTAADHVLALAEGGRPDLLLSAGRAVLGTEVRIVDENDEPVPNGVVGEICGRGPQLMRGYWNLPEATEAALKGGWMHTGDAGILDDDGYLYVQDRVKDMIVSGGENIYPREIEDALYEHPAIAEAAVIGIPDERFGETVKAVVALKDGETASAEELVAFCRERLAGYKQPRSVDFVEELPRNPSGKVLKRELREPYWVGRDRQVS